MTTVARMNESINIPTDRAAYRAWLRGLDEPTRALLFGVVLGADTFRCPTNGRLYIDTAPELRDGCCWTRCYWCDTAGRVRGESGFDRDARQPHCHPIVRD
jgi:hypothetical protein